MRRGFLAVMATVGLGLFAGAAQADWHHDGRHGGGFYGHDHSRNHGHVVRYDDCRPPVRVYQRAYSPVVRPYAYYPYPQSNFSIATPRFSFSISR